MSRLIVFFLVLGFFSTFFLGLANAQMLGNDFRVQTEEATTHVRSDEDDGYLWIAFNLSDVNAPGVLNEHWGTYSVPLIRDAWTTTCTRESPTSIDEPLTLGFRQNHPSQPARRLDAVTCERYLDVRVSGTIADREVNERRLRWQPGEDGRRWLGVPRNGTTEVTFTFPETITADGRAYFRDEPLTIPVTPESRFLSVNVAYQRYARLVVRQDNNREIAGEVLVTGERLVHNATESFIRPGMQTIQAPKGYNFRLHDIRPDLTPGMTFPAGHDYDHYDLELRAGWSYVFYLSPRSSFVSQAR